MSADMYSSEFIRIGSSLPLFAQALEETLLGYMTRLHAATDVDRYQRAQMAASALHAIWTDYRNGRAQTPHERALGYAIDSCIGEIAAQNLVDREAA